MKGIDEVEEDARGEERRCDREIEGERKGAKREGKRRAQRNSKLTNSSRKMISVQGLDVLDLEGVDVEIVHSKQGDGVL